MKKIFSLLAFCGLLLLSSCDTDPSKDDPGKNPPAWIGTDYYQTVNDFLSSGYLPKQVTYQGETQTSFQNFDWLFVVDAQNGLVSSITRLRPIYDGYTMPFLIQLFINGATLNNQLYNATFTEGTIQLVGETYARTYTSFEAFVGALQTLTVDQISTATLSAPTPLSGFNNSVELSLGYGPLTVDGQNIHFFSTLFMGVVPDTSTSAQ